MLKSLLLLSCATVLAASPIVLVPGTLAAQQQFDTAGMSATQLCVMALLNPEDAGSTVGMFLNGSFIASAPVVLRPVSTNGQTISLGTVSFPWFDQTLLGRFTIRLEDQGALPITLQDISAGISDCNGCSSTGATKVGDLSPFGIGVPNAPPPAPAPEPKAILLTASGLVVLLLFRKRLTWPSSARESAPHV